MGYLKEWATDKYRGIAKDIRKAHRSVTVVLNSVIAALNGQKPLPFVIK